MQRDGRTVRRSGRLRHDNQLHYGCRLRTRWGFQRRRRRRHSYTRDGTRSSKQSRDSYTRDGTCSSRRPQSLSRQAHFTYYNSGSDCFFTLCDNRRVCSLSFIRPITYLANFRLYFEAFDDSADFSNWETTGFWIGVMLSRKAKFANNLAAKINAGTELITLVVWVAGDVSEPTRRLGLKAPNTVVCGLVSSWNGETGDGVDKAQA